MTEQTKTRIPAPIYAAAGAGDLAYEQLRRLPAVVTELRGKATAGTADLRQRAVDTRDELRERAASTLKDARETAADLRGKATESDFDLEHLREIARRNAHAVLAGAQAAQARAVEVYHQLVLRGEKVVGGGVVQAADTVNADIEATEIEAAKPAAVTATPADVAAVVEGATKVEQSTTTTATPAAKTTKATKAAKATAKAPAKRTRPAAQK
jgi:hypothetical protein